MVRCKMSSRKEVSICLELERRISQGITLRIRNGNGEHANSSLVPLSKSI